MGLYAQLPHDKSRLLIAFPVSHHSMQIPHSCHQGLSTYKAILSDHAQQSMVLTSCGLPRSPMDLPGTKVAAATIVWFTLVAYV